MLTTTEISIAVLDSKCKAYSLKRAVLADRVSALESEIAELKKKHLPGIKSAAASCSDLQADLRNTIEQAPGLFVKPKTFTLWGIKIGFVKGKGKLAWDIEDAELVKRIKRNFAADACELLIVVTESPSKEGISKLPANELKRLGVTIEEAGEQIVVKASDSEIDKLVAKMIDEGAKPIEEAN